MFRWLPICGRNDAFEGNLDWGDELSPEEIAHRDATYAAYLRAAAAAARKKNLYAGDAQIYNPSNISDDAPTLFKSNARLYAAVDEFDERGGEYTLGYFKQQDFIFMPRLMDDGKADFMDLYVAINEMIRENLLYSINPQMFGYNELYRKLVREYKIRTEKYFGTPADEIRIQERLAIVIDADPESKGVGSALQMKWGPELYASSTKFGDATKGELGEDKFDLGQSEVAADLERQRQAAGGGAAAAAAAAASQLEPYDEDTGGRSLFGVAKYGTPEANGEAAALKLFSLLPGI